MTLSHRSMIAAISIWPHGRHIAATVLYADLLAGQDDKMGLLVHKAGGAEHGHWIFDYDVTDEDDDELGFLFGSHTFVPGEYVSVRATDGAMHTFAVHSVDPL